LDQPIEQQDGLDPAVIAEMRPVFDRYRRATGAVLKALEEGDTEAALKKAEAFRKDLQETTCEVCHDEATYLLDSVSSAALCQLTPQADCTAEMAKAREDAQNLMDLLDLDQLASPTPSEGIPGTAPAAATSSSST